MLVLQRRDSVLVHRNRIRQVLLDGSSGNTGLRMSWFTNDSLIKGAKDPKYSL